MVERFLSQTSFSSQEDFIKNLKINVPENFNFGYDVVDAWAAEPVSYTHLDVYKRQPQRRRDMIKAGIIGGAGYTAGELIRLLLNHPETEIVFINSSSTAGNKITDIHRCV